jgi:translation elongation factor EF-1alpha
MATEEKVGTVVGYYAKVGVAAVNLTDGALQIGDRIRIHGHTTDFTQVVESLQVEHQPIQRADRGSEIALKVRERVRPHDEVLKVTD